MKMSVIVADGGKKKEFSVEVPGKITAEMIDAIGATIRREFNIPDPPNMRLKPELYLEPFWIYQPYRPWYYEVTCDSNTSTATTTASITTYNSIDGSYAVNVRDAD